MTTEEHLLRIALERGAELAQAERRVREYVDQYNGQWLDYFREQRRTRRQVAQIVARAMDQPVSLPAIRSAMVKTPDAVLERRLCDRGVFTRPIEVDMLPGLTWGAIREAVGKIYERGKPRA